MGLVPVPGRGGQVMVIGYVRVIQGKGGRGRQVMVIGYLRVI